MSSDAPARSMIQRRFTRSVTTYSAAASVQRKMARYLVTMCACQSYPLIVELGAGTGFLSDEIVRKLDYGRLIALDMVPEYAGFHAARPRTEFVAADMEHWTFPAGVDLVAANAVVQWAEDLLGLLRRIRAALTEGGELLFSTFAPSNLAELEPFRSRKMNYFSMAELEKMLDQAGVTVTRMVQTTETLEFADPVAVLRHLHDTGVGAPGASGRVWTKKDLAALAGHCRTPGGTYALNYQPLYIAGRRKS